MSKNEVNQIDGIGCYQGDPRHDVTIFKTTAMNLHANFSMSMIEKWGGVAAVPDGEDSRGRQKLRLQTPEELVKRACDTASLLIKEQQKRGWILEVPVPSLYETTA